MKWKQFRGWEHRFDHITAMNASLMATVCKLVYLDLHSLRTLASTQNAKSSIVFRKEIFSGGTLCYRWVDEVVFFSHQFCHVSHFTIFQMKYQEERHLIVQTMLSDSQTKTTDAIQHKKNQTDRIERKKETIIKSCEKRKAQHSELIHIHSNFSIKINFFVLRKWIWMKWIRICSLLHFEYKQIWGTVVDDIWI